MPNYPFLGLNDYIDEMLFVIKNIISKNEQKNFYVFGMNVLSDRVVRFLKDNEYEVHGILDNNPAYYGKKFLDIVVNSPEYFLKDFDKNACIFIQSSYFSEMKEQLSKLGYQEETHIIKTVNIETSEDFDNKEELFNQFSDKIKLAVNLYNELTGNKKLKLFLLPQTPLGDVYIFCSYLSSYMEKEGLKEIIIALRNESQIKIANMFIADYNDLKIKIKKISVEETDLLRNLSILFPEHVNLFHPIDNKYLFYNYNDFKGINFFDHCKKGLFGLNEDIKPRHPTFNRNELEIDKFFKENNLESEKTIIISPYANSVPMSAYLFWKILVERLKVKKYDVVTNCGTIYEKPIEGTKAVYFDFEDSVPILNRCKALIAYRSGFCDITSSATCKKIFIYPYKQQLNTTMYQLYSQKDFFGKVESFVLNEETDEVIISKIIDLL
ncbi:MAG: hypothetical protein GX219_08605 [Tissierellia bacterium]|nr:hypothetical protein [Tissierellia bacterium]